MSSRAEKESKLKNAHEIYLRASDTITIKVNEI